MLNCKKVYTDQRTAKALQTLKTQNDDDHVVSRHDARADPGHGGVCDVRRDAGQKPCRSRGGASLPHGGEGVLRGGDAEVRRDEHRQAGGNDCRVGDGRGASP